MDLYHGEMKFHDLLAAGIHSLFDDGEGGGVSVGRAFRGDENRTFFQGIDGLDGKQLRIARAGSGDPYQRAYPAGLFRGRPCLPAFPHADTSR